MPRKRRKERIPEPVLESTAQFARRSGLGLTLTRHLVHTGELPSVVLKRRRWVPVAEALASLRAKIEPRRPAA